MALMRLFIGLDLPAGVVGNLEALLGRLRTSARIQWSPPANLHITTKFIGEWPEERLGELKAALKNVPARAAFEIAIRDLGFFPNERNPRVFWCGIQAIPLPALAADTENVTASLGIAREERAYSPHLTLARIKERIDLRPLQQAVASLPSRDFGSFTAGSFFLYQSQLRPSGSVYTKLAEYPFTHQ